MPLSLKQLAQIVPIREETRKKVLEQEETLTEGQKFKISQICWRLLSFIIDARRKEKFDQMIKEMAEGGIEYEHEDFTRAEDEIISEFLIKIDEVQSKEKLAAVKSEMEKHLPKKETTPVSSQSSPPSPSTPAEQSSS